MRLTSVRFKSYEHFNNHPTKQARKLQAMLEGCNPKLSLTDSLTDMGKV